MKLYLIFLTICGMFLVLKPQAQIIVQNNVPVQQLGLNELIGPGISASVIHCSGDSVSNIGTFSGVSNIGISEGVILATGNISVCIGPNDEASASQSDSTCPGDTDMDSLCGETTFDAMVIEFDFIPASDSIELTFVFGSEEYPEYVCSNFNDVFAFLLSGPNPDSTVPYDKTNIAKIPGTSLPVAINSVNPGVSGQNWSDGGCLSLSYSSLYLDNSTGLTIEYDGFTVPLTIYAHVFADSLYHIKFAIADAYDASYDSGVFFKKNSFKCVEQTTASNEENLIMEIRLSPNPAENNFRVLSDYCIQSVCIISPDGLIIKSYLKSIPEYIDTQDLSTGLYFVRITHDKGITTMPLIVSH